MVMLRARRSLLQVQVIQTRLRWFTGSAKALCCRNDTVKMVSAYMPYIYGWREVT